MSDKPKQRDILGDILNDPHNETIRGIDELTKLIHASSNDPARKAQVKNPVLKRKPRQSPKQKTTHYLTKEVFDNLGEAREDIRDFLPNASKSMATKSRIVESAITVVLHEFEKKGKDSALFQELLKKKDE
jgi:hypothetical protein